MSYRAEISRASPTAIVMVIDQSSSMSHRLGSGQSKAAFLADVLNKTLYTLITSCSKADGVRDYFHVGVVAYGGDEAPKIDGELTKAVHNTAPLGALRTTIEHATIIIAGLARGRARLGG